MPRKLPIFYSALMLTGVNLLLRLVGTSFQVYLSGRIGAEGIGLLQLTLSAGAMAMVAGTGGIRTATMYLTAEESGRKHPENLPSVLAGCCLYSICLSICVAAGLWVFAPQIASVWIGNADVTDCLRLYSAFLPVNCLCGVMVGFFTGANRIGTLALIEVIEQLFTMASTIVLLRLYAGGSAESACLCVVFGGGLGACLTLLMLTLIRCQDHCDPKRRIPIARRLMNTALPLAVADDLRTGISTVENMMVPRRLALYHDSITPLAAFGTVTGMVFPVLMFPAAFLFGLTELLIPELARCNAAGSHTRIDHLVRKSLKLALLYGTLWAGILYLIAPELCLTLYKSREAGTYLRWFSLLAIMLYSDSVIDAMIKGLGQQSASVRYNIITNVMDVVFLFFLLPVLGIRGYFISFLVTHGINLLLSLGRLVSITKMHIPIRIPALTIVVMVLAILAASYCRVAIIKIVCYVAFLICGLFLCGVISKRDVRWVKGMIRKNDP